MTYIWQQETSTTASWLVVDDAGSIVLHEENAAWLVIRKGLRPRAQTMSLDEAVGRWPEHEVRIRAAVAAATR